ncbi:unnamed protein product [Hymenolepis diminuta]|uniref:Adenine phosphoribosyltransferase n=1 Tax=Hymenolepis diminuta TaxID=6216 RepID=A0A564YMZ4_HYMDI|nr:unnamed protein product [Hymenolepis diminuta]
MTDPRAERIKKAIKTYPDFPKTGINFLDIFPIFQDQTTINDCIALMAEEIQKRFLDEGQEIDAIVGLESRGFIFGILLSTHFKVPFIPIRKAGKLPGECVKYSYDLEYGSATLELQISALKPGSKVVIIDDVLAIGGTMSAAAKLCREASLEVLGAGVLLQIVPCKGGQRLDEMGLKWFSILHFD